MAPVTTVDSRSRSATSGMSTRITAAAIANAPRMEPITEADSPRSCPSSGTTKVCTSQHDDSSQFTMSSRRKPGSASRSQARARVPSSAATTGGISCVPRTQNQVASGNTAMSAKAARKPMVAPACAPA